MTVKILLVEDDKSLRASLEKFFTRKGHEVIVTGSVGEARRILHTFHVGLLLLDMRLPDGTGLDVLATSRAVDEEIPVIVMTAFPEVRTAVHAMKEGARDFIVKPFELDELYFTFQRAIEAVELRRKVQRLEREHHQREDGVEILGTSPPIQKLKEDIEKVADTDAHVLIVGETGTGKELVADSIHRLSSRNGSPLLKSNCSAFSEQLLESELFGHEKGAFTDAKESRPGLFEMANMGTLFLDEISEMKPELQAKLLRIVEGQSFRRVGGQREIRADVRVIAATNRDLEEAIQARTFRKDLYYRLNVFKIEVPPLSARGDDVILLASHFLEQFAVRLRRTALLLSTEAKDILLNYSWPGNIRELRNMMERAAILCGGGEVGSEHLPSDLQAEAYVRQTAEGSRALPSLAKVEQRYVAHVLERVGGNISEAARILGVARNTLKAKLKLPDDP